MSTEPDDLAIPPGASTGRAVDRLINFSDAVVAVAITLLVLPIIDLRPGDGQTFAQLVAENAAQLGVFIFTFLLVSLMWRVHNRVLNGIRAYDSTVFWVNTLWLTSIALLPWLSAQLGDSGWDTDTPDGTIGCAFWGTLGVTSLLTAAMSLYLRHHPALLQPAERRDPSEGGIGRLRGLIFGAYFMASAVLCLFWPEWSHYAGIVIIPLSIWVRPAR
ncbi:MAG: TMEM175 family protein [Actinobacteria bacterium]|nr:TMEM175 family protein [Actinomycetota bacterium]